MADPTILIRGIVKSGFLGERDVAVLRQQAEEIDVVHGATLDSIPLIALQRLTETFRAA